MTSTSCVNIYLTSQDEGLGPRELFRKHVSFSDDFYQLQLEAEANKLLLYCLSGNGKHEITLSYLPSHPNFRGQTSSPAGTFGPEYNQIAITLHDGFNNMSRALPNVIKFVKCHMAKMHPDSHQSKNLRGEQNHCECHCCCKTECVVLK